MVLGLPPVLVPLLRRLSGHDRCDAPGSLVTISLLPVSTDLLLWGLRTAFFCLTWCFQGSPVPWPVRTPFPLTAVEESIL